MAQIAIRIDYERYLLLQPGMLDKISGCHVIGRIGYDENAVYYNIPTQDAIHVSFIETETLDDAYRDRESAQAAYDQMQADRDRESAQAAYDQMQAAKKAAEAAKVDE